MSDQFGTSVSEQELGQALEQEFEDRAEPEITDDPAPEPVEEPTDEPTGEDEPVVEVDAETEQAKRLYSFLQSRPDIAQALVGVERGEYTVVPRQALEQQHQPEPEPVQEIDFWSDPEKAFRTLNEKLLAQEQFIAQKTQSDNHAAIQTGMAVFARNHPELKPDEVEQVGASLRDKGLLPTYWARQPNYVGVSEAMEDAYRITNFGRSRDVAAKDIAKASKDKRRAAAVGGSRASAPRSEPMPTDPRERHAAMVREIESAMVDNS